MNSNKEIVTQPQINSPQFKTTPSLVPKSTKNVLFDLIYKFPLSREQIESYPELHQNIQNVIKQLTESQKTNSEEIQKVCNSNHRLTVVSKILRQCASLYPEHPKDINFGGSLISMFSVMIVSNKMIDFLNKIMVTFSVYRMLVKIFNLKGNKREITRQAYYEIIRKQQAYECIKFLGKWVRVSSRTFPRSFANFLQKMLIDFPRLDRQDRNILLQKQGQEMLNIDCPSRQSQKIIELYNYITLIASDLIQTNLKLSAQSGILLIMFKRAIQGQLTWMITQQIIETIIKHMGKQQQRKLILSHLDLGKAFALFTNVDSRKDTKVQQKIQKNAHIIRLLITSWNTLIYFIHQKVTLKNFIVSLSSKSSKQITIINDRIFSKIIDRALIYKRDKMQTSQNTLGLHSNYLNLRYLLIMSYFLDSTNLFEIYRLRDPKGQILRNLGKLALMYFPITFERDKYNKLIINNIRLPSMKNSQPLTSNFLNWFSYANQCIINYQFSKVQLLNCFNDVNKIQEMQNVPSELLTQMKLLLDKLKKLMPNNCQPLLLPFYKTMVQISQYLPWKPEYLNLSKFLSEIVGYLCRNCFKDISQFCIQIAQKLFKAPKQYFYRYLYVTVLDDIGRYFGDMDAVQQLILASYQDPDYSFRISRILLHMDFDKKQAMTNFTQKQILYKICSDNGCEQLILQAIQIIKFYCLQNDDKGQWGVRLICQKILYHTSQEIVHTAIQFCQQVVIKHRYCQTIVHKAQLDNILDPKLRKRLMYIMLRSEIGIDNLEKKYPKFIKNQLESWFKQGTNMIKQFAIFLSKQHQKYAANKDVCYIDIGNQITNRYSLIHIPWNIKLNGFYFIALASYKHIKEKIKLRINPNLIIEDQIKISMFQMGAVPALKSQSEHFLVIKREQILRNYNKNMYRQTKQIKKFAVSKDKLTFIMNYSNNDLILVQLIVNIPLSRNVYRPLIYPLNFIGMLTLSTRGLDLLREHKNIDQCINLIMAKKDTEAIKGSIVNLGVLFASNKLEVGERVDIFQTVVKCMDLSLDSEIKEVAHWVLAIIIKDEDFRRKLKEQKNWLFLQSKYCGWLCYPQFGSSKYQSYSNPIKRFDYFNGILPEKPSDPGYYLILSVLESYEKGDTKNQKLRDKKKQAYEYFKKPENREIAWHSQLFCKVFAYIAAVNFELDKIKQVLDIYSEYLNSQQFDRDFPMGYPLP